jgi:(5-formylfuran-3-yl)methyl phosphate synthase
MRLLVSVRSAEEAREAVAGGADIVDAKEPGHGPLGAVDASVLGAIAAAVPPAVPISAALGDLPRPEDAAAAVRAAGDVLGARSGPRYLKLGFYGLSSRADAERVLAAAIPAARDVGVGLIAAAYADYPVAGTPDPRTIATVAAELGIAGVLVDTWSKDRHDLLYWMPPEHLEAWVSQAGRSGLITAVAGRLGAPALQRLQHLGADIIGVRGAACVAGRLTAIDARRVAALKSALAGVDDPDLKSQPVIA